MEKLTKEELENIRYYLNNFGPDIFKPDFEETWTSTVMQLIEELLELKDE